MKKFFKNLFTGKNQNSKSLDWNSDFVFDVIKPGSIAIDCGANIGDIASIMLGKGAIVHAFEPNPHAYKVLSERFKNNINFIGYNKGVWHKKEKLKLFMHENAQDDPVKWSTGSSILEFKSNINEGDFIEVELIDLTDFIKSLNSEIALLKIDIE